MPITFYESNNSRQERAARTLIAGEKQARLNAAEWLRRAEQTDDMTLACNLVEQIELELQPYRRNWRKI